nr:amylo-alpha-1,6-glucosidase [Tautonia sociabilis]
MPSGTTRCGTWPDGSASCSARKRSSPLSTTPSAAGAPSTSGSGTTKGGYLYDLVDGEDGRDDPSCRPNQSFAISLPHPVLDESRWRPVFETVHDRLLTPVGLRSLAPGHPDYTPKSFGDRRSRDAASHQGTVWGWLIGPFLDAWLKVLPDDRAGARACLDVLIAHLDDFRVGSIAEVFDAEPPFHPRGRIAQAWSVAEVLRCLIRTTDAD